VYIWLPLNGSSAYQVVPDVTQRYDHRPRLFGVMIDIVCARASLAAPREVPVPNAGPDTSFRQSSFPVCKSSALTV